MSAIRLLMRLSLTLLLGLSLLGIVLFASLPASAATITEFTTPTPDSGPFGITVGPDGNLWFTEDSHSANGIGRITTAGVVIEFPIATPDAIPSAITVGPDGNLWFTEFNGNKIGRITTDGVITEFAIPTVESVPYGGITAGPDGNLWFTEAGGNKIGRITTDGVITEFVVPTADSQPHGITAGPDSNLWFTELFGNKIGRITTDGVITEFVVPTADSGPAGIAADPDGNLWFTEHIGNKIGRITTAGVITEFTVPTADSGPQYITVGPDGNLWFTEARASGNKIGRITTDGVITEFAVPTADSYPAGITVGPDGNLWFTEEDAGKIGRIFSVSTPATPTGPFSGITGTPYPFMTGGSTSILGNPVEYQFDWKGDGSDLSAYGSATQSKTWTAAGTYTVRARAYDTVNTSVVSSWSSGFSVTITAPAGPNVVISSISGPSTGKPGGRISIQNTVTNQGIQTASNVTVNFYISTDTQIDTGDKLIGKRTISNLAPGGSSGPVSTMVTIPKNITQGFYFIGGIVGNNTNFDPKGITICLSLLKAKLLSPKNKGRNVSRSPALSWSNVSVASSYEVQVATDSGFTNIAASMTGLTSIQWTVTPALSGGTTYFWRARAVNPCGPGPWSMTWSFKTM